MERRIWRERVTAGLILWGTFSGLEVLMVGKFDPQETPVGIAIGAVVAAATVAIYEATEARYRPRLRWLSLLPLLLRNALRDTLLVYGILLRRLAGGPLPADAAVEVPFDAGGDDPVSAAHRAVALAAVSFAPNSIALYEHPDRNTLLVHYLEPRARKPQSPWWPI